MHDTDPAFPRADRHRKALSKESPKTVGKRYILRLKSLVRYKVGVEEMLCTLIDCSVPTVDFLLIQR